MTTLAILMFSLMVFGTLMSFWGSNYHKWLHKNWLKLLANKRLCYFPYENFGYFYIFVVAEYDFGCPARTFNLENGKLVAGTAAHLKFYGIYVHSKPLQEHKGILKKEQENILKKLRADARSSYVIYNLWGVHRIKVSNSEEHFELATEHSSIMTFMDSKDNIPSDLFELVKSYYGIYDYVRNKKTGKVESKIKSQLEDMNWTHSKIPWTDYDADGEYYSIHSKYPLLPEGCYRGESHFPSEIEEILIPLSNVTDDVRYPPVIYRFWREYGDDGVDHPNSAGWSEQLSLHTILSAVEVSYDYISEPRIYTNDELYNFTLEQNSNVKIVTRQYMELSEHGFRKTRRTQVYEDSEGNEIDYDIIQSMKDSLQLAQEKYDEETSCL